MAISHPVFTERIEGSPETIFDLVADMPNYGRWLPGSRNFGATNEVTPYPVQLGTTYVDGGPAGERPGTVTEFERPNHIGFHQTMLVRQGPLTANIDIRIRYSFERDGEATDVTRALDVSIDIPGPLKIAEPLVLGAIRKENVRLLESLKRYVESRPAG